MKNFRNNKLYKSRTKPSIRNNKNYLEKAKDFNKKQTNIPKKPYFFYENEKNAFLLNRIFDILPPNKIDIKTSKSNYMYTKNMCLQKNFRVSKKNKIYFNLKNNKNIFKFSFFR